MPPLETLIYCASVVLQVAALAFCIRTSRAGGVRGPWLVMAGALTIMAVFRIVRMLTQGPWTQFQIPEEVFARMQAFAATAISLLLLLSLFSIRRLSVARIQALAALHESKQISEARLAQLQGVFAAMTEGVFIADSSGQLVTMNPAALAMNEFASMKDALQQLSAYPDLFELSDLSGDLIPLERWPISRVLGGARFVGQEVRVRRRNSEKKTVISYGGTPVLDESGKVALAVLTFRDVTEKKALEITLRENADRLSLAIAAADLGDWQWNPSSDLLTLSRRAAEIFGVPANLPLTRAGMRDLIHPLDRDRARLANERSVFDQTEYDIEYRVNRHDGKRIWVAAKGRGQYDADGNIISMLGVVQDITQRKLAESALAEEFQMSETLRLVGTRLAATLDLNDILQSVTDAGARVIRARFGVFLYSPAGDYTKAPVVCATSGLSPDILDTFSMSRAAEVFGLALNGHAAVRVADLKAESASGGGASSQFGSMVGPLPMTSFLAVPVKSRSGGQLGGLFFGHEDAGVFTDRDERVIQGIAVQAAVAIDSAALYEAERKARGEAEAANAVKDQLLASERSARNEAERASRMKDEFLATLSHELRTPLNAILGWAQLLRVSGRSEEDLSQGLSTIERNARAQTKIIEDLLDMSRIISGKIRLDVQRLDLITIIRGALETVRHAAEAKGVSVETSFDPQAATVMGDGNRLQQVFWNLLSNAVKFSKRGDSVRIALARVHSHVEMTVSDVGEGIKPEFLPFVFDRFRQADASTTRRHGGLGLGLSIAKQLAELHGGTLLAASAGEGQGSTFTVVLPLSAVHPEADPSPRDGLGRPAVTADQARDRSRLNGIRILVVDDEADARALIQRLLEECDAKVVTAGSAAEAMESMRGGPPDVLVSDIGMPGDDGYWLIRQVREMTPAAGGTIPAVALTAYARAEDRMKAVTAGFQMHVAKPVEPAELVTMIASLAGRSTVRG